MRECETESESESPEKSDEMAVMAEIAHLGSDTLRFTVSDTDYYSLYALQALSTETV